jgi:hypothetical protein
MMLSKRTHAQKKQKTKLLLRSLGKPLSAYKVFYLWQDKEEFPLAMRDESMTFNLKKFPRVLSQMVWFSNWARLPIC